MEQIHVKSCGKLYEQQLIMVSIRYSWLLDSGYHVSVEK